MSQPQVLSYHFRMVFRLCELLKREGDPANGTLNVDSAWLKKLSTIEVDDEITVLLDGVETSVVFMRHEMAASRAVAA